MAHHTKSWQQQQNKVHNDAMNILNEPKKSFDMYYVMFVLFSPAVALIFYGSRVD